MHKPIQFKNVCFSLPHKRCFEQFNETISYGQRIAIIGQNGSGKSTLLRLIQNLIKSTDGELVYGLFRIHTDYISLFYS